MIDSAIFKSSFFIVLAHVMQALVPGLLATGSLYLCAFATDAPINDTLVRLSALVFILSAVVVQPPRIEPSQVLGSRAPLALAVVLQWIVLLTLLMVVGYATKYTGIYSRIMVATWALATPPILVLTYLGLNELRRRAMAHPDAARTAVFAGCNELTLALAERVRSNSEYGISVSGFFDDRGADRLGIDVGTRLLGRLPELAEYVNTHRVDVIFIALPIRHIARVMNLLDDLRDTTASIYYVPDIFVFDLIQARTSDIGGIPVVAMCETPFQGYRGTVKRVMDLVLSASVLLLLSPVMIVAALAIGLTSRGPVIFKQRRYGLDGLPIEVYKFRTMTVMEDGHVVRQATRDDQRITAVGRILRRSSLDELPQLLNVLQGNMSLVGPRPHAIAHNEQYRKLIKGYMVRHKVLPGITGLAQVNGCRGEIEKIEDMERRLNFDIEYLRRWSPLLDINIMFLTVMRVFGDERAY